MNAEEHGVGGLFSWGDEQKGIRVLGECLIRDLERNKWRMIHGIRRTISALEIVLVVRALTNR